jgi:hypothetical protein
MLVGDFEQAWTESDAIERRGSPDPNRFWTGQSLDGKRVLIRCLHGLGDTIQFIRYAPLVRERASAVTIEAQPLLKALLVYSGLADHVMTWREPEPPWDVQVEVIELPKIFRTQLGSVPASVPYLRAPYDQNLTPSARKRIGLVWSSSTYNPARSIPLTLLAEICGTCNAEFFSFQAGEPRCDLTAHGARITDLCEASGSVLVTASRMLRMDLVISVDTMTAHLAGALGLPVWTLLPFEGDWRWMLDRTDSPWYPTMRLFRQPRPGDWESVVRDLQRELRSG